MSDAPPPAPQRPPDSTPQRIDLNVLAAIALKDPKDLTADEFMLAVRYMSTIP